jgi:dienelactone hydrolase
VFDNGPEGYGYERVKDRYREISPIHNIAKGTPPTIVFLGSEDKHTPVATAQKYKKLMEEKSSRCELRVYEGQKHGFFNLHKSFSEPKYFYQTVIETDQFLQSLGYLEGKPTLTVPKNNPS